MAKKRQKASSKATAKRRAATAKREKRTAAARPRASAKRARSGSRRSPGSTARKASKRAAPPMDPEAMMAAWQKAMTPAEGHRRLEPLVGSFAARTTMWMTPDAPPDVHEGTSEHRWALGGRYVEQIYNGIHMGMPFEGRGFTGYDNNQQKYVATWMDTYSTGMMNSLGSGKATDAEIPTDAEVVDPSGQRVRFQCLLRIQDHDHHSFEMWTKGPGGRRHRTMLVEYTRQP